MQSEPVDVTWTGEKLNVPDVLMEKYKTKFPHLDLIAIITDSERWLLKHPQKASTYKSFDAFLNNWMRGEEEKRKKRDGNDYELTGESLATAEQCARIHGRAVNE